MFTVDELLNSTKARLISAYKDRRIKGICLDSRTIKEGEAFIAIKGVNFDGHDFINEAIKKKASCIIRASQGKGEAALYSRRTNRNVVVVEAKDTVKALGDIAKFHRQRFDIPVIAITGSNGKTTTKDMVAWVLSHKFEVLKNIGTKNNQIGLPQTLLGLNSSHDFAVLEVGTNHFGEVGYLAQICLANIGIITNIGHSHLEYFKNLKGVLSEKYTLIKHLKNPYIAMLNSDDLLLRKKVLKKSKQPFILGFGIKNRSDFYVTNVRVLKDRIEFIIKQKYKFTLWTLGYYNIYNALVAIALGRIVGMDYKDISDRLATFTFPQGRLNFIELNNIRFIDDSYNSNPLSLRQALETLDALRVKGRKIFVMGDMLELGKGSESFHRQGGCHASRVCDVFISVGKLSRSAAKEAGLRGLNAKNIFSCESIAEAREVLFKKISLNPQDIVLVKGSRAMKMEGIFKTS